MSNRVQLKKLGSALKTKKRDIKKNIAIAIVAAPLYFFVPGSQKIVKKGTNYIEKGLKLLRHKDTALSVAQEMRMTEHVFASVDSYVKNYIAGLNTIVSTNNTFAFKKIVFTGPNVNWAVSVDEIEPKFANLMATTRFMAYSMENSEYNALDNFARALILLTQHLTPDKDITKIIPDINHDKSQMATYITLVNMLQMALVKDVNPMYNTIQQTIHSMLFSFQEPEEKLGGGINFMLNPMHKIKSIYNLDNMAIDNSIFSMYYSRDSLSKGIITDYMKYIIFSSIRDDAQRQQFELLEEQLMKYMEDKHVKYEDMLISDSPINTYKLTLEFKSGEPIHVTGHGNIEQVFVLMVNKLMALLLTRIDKPVDIDIVEIQGAKDSNERENINKEEPRNAKQSAIFKVRHDTRGIKRFIELAKKEPKYRFILDLYISKNAPYYNMLYNRLLNMYCPIELNNAIHDTVLFNNRETNVSNNSTSV